MKMSETPTPEWASKYADFLETILPVMEATEIQVRGQPVDNMAGVTAARLNIAALRTFAEHGRSAAKYRSRIIRELVEKAEAEAKDAANSAGIEKHYTWQAQVAWWLKSQLEGGE
jgi:hypothetical protein